MDVRRIPFRHLYIPGFLITLLGIILITYSVHWRRTEADPDRIAVASMTSFSILGAFFLIVGGGFCMGWCMVSDVQALGVEDTQQPRAAINIGRMNKGREHLGWNGTCFPVILESSL